jgi:hypothetical protein
MQFVKKTSSRKSFAGLLIKLSVALIIILGVIFLLNKIEFPAPKKEIEKIISNENLKVVK